MKRELLNIKDPAYLAWKRRKDEQRMLETLLNGENRESADYSDQSLFHLSVAAYRPFLLGAALTLALIVIRAVLGSVI